LIESPENVLTELGQIVPTAQLVQVRTRRKYIKAKQTETLAVEKVRKNWSDGITIADLVTNGIARNKSQAQRMMKYYYNERKILFTLERQCPQNAEAQKFYDNMVANETAIKTIRRNMVNRIGGE